MQLRCISLFCPFQELARTFHPLPRPHFFCSCLYWQGSFFLAEEDCISMHSLNRSMHGPQVRLNCMHARFKIQTDMKPWHDLHIILRCMHCCVLCVCVKRFGSKLIQDLLTVPTVRTCLFVYEYARAGCGGGGVFVSCIYTQRTNSQIHIHFTDTHLCSLASCNFQWTYTKTDLTRTKLISSAGVSAHASVCH
jgi:hypothetical protein